jgi:CheY-like chemotaxis protein
MQKFVNPKFRILVVDDEPSVCRSLKMLLEHDGHAVQTVDGGEAALALFEPGRFDLVITDYSMPDMKGDELAMLIRQREPDQAIIMASGLAGEQNDLGRLTVKVDAVLNKPFSLAELREAVALVLS